MKASAIETENRSGRKSECFIHWIEFQNPRSFDWGQSGVTWSVRPQIWYWTGDKGLRHLGLKFPSGMNNFLPIDDRARILDFSKEKYCAEYAFVIDPCFE